MRELTEDDKREMRRVCVERIAELQDKLRAVATMPPSPMKTALTRKHQSLITKTEETLRRY